MQSELGTIEGVRFTGFTATAMPRVDTVDGEYICFLHPDIERELRGYWVRVATKRLQRSAKARKRKYVLVKSYRWSVYM